MAPVFLLKEGVLKRTKGQAERVRLQLKGKKHLYVLRWWQ